MKIDVLRLFLIQKVLTCSEFLKISPNSIDLGPTAIFFSALPSSSNSQSLFSVWDEGNSITFLSLEGILASNSYFLFSIISSILSGS